MIKVKIKGKKYFIKTKWEELTFGEYLDILRAPDELTSVERLTTIPVEILMQLDKQSQDNLTLCLNFMQNPPEEAKNCKDIKKETWGQKIILQNQLKNEDKNILFAYALACYEYDYKNIDKAVNFLLTQPFNLVYCRGLNYLNQLTKVLKAEQNTLSTPVTIEQKQAGIENFDEFGIVNSLDRLAGGNILFYEKLLNIDYNTIFVKLKLLKCDGDFKQAYTKIMNK